MTIDQAETRRRVLAKRALVSAVVALAVVVVVAVLWRGETASADRATVTPEVRAQIAESAASKSLPTEPAPAPEKAVVQPPVVAKPSQSGPKPQRFPVAIGVDGYEPAVINASAGSPIVLVVERGQGCAAGFLIPGLNVAEDNSAGPVTISLGRVPAGSYQYSCGMEMVTGTLIVK